jgi:hypothetical protein
MSEVELLASIACSLATANGMSCSPAALKNQAACIWPCMSEIELLAAIACILAVGGGGGGGGIDYNLEYPSAADLPFQPDDVTKVWTVYFLNGDPSMRWSPSLQAWV